MSSLDATLIRDGLDDAIESRLERLEVFPAIGSTNSYLMQQSPPAPGMIRVAVTDNQTAGRGRHGKTWQSPPGSGLALSLAYTYADKPENLPALTLTIGLAAINALEATGVGNVQLKWPNDLIAGDRKLGGILTEAQSGDHDTITIVTGIGINVFLPDDLDLGGEAQSASPPTDLASVASSPPAIDLLAARLIESLAKAIAGFGSSGLDADSWRDRDWLLGRDLTVETANARVSGVGAGIAGDGALLLRNGETVQRVTTGSVIEAGARSEPE